MLPNPLPSNESATSSESRPAGGVGGQQRLRDRQRTPLGAARASPARADRRTTRHSITVIAGCMFSGKTTELLSRLERFHLAHRFPPDQEGTQGGLDAAPRARSLAFKHAADSRYSSSQIVSHAGKAAPAIAVRDSTEILDHLQRRLSCGPPLPRADKRGSSHCAKTEPAPGEGIKLVVIDEGHFFDDGLLDVVRLTARVCDVAVAALQPDSWARPFPLVTRLFELADEALFKHATCARCGARADRTQRLTPIVAGQMVVAPRNYEPRCRACWQPPLASD